MPEKHDQQRATQSNSTSPISVTSKTSDRSQSRIRLTPTVAKRQWNELVEAAARATPFHRYGFLDTLAEHTGTTFFPFVGLENDRPIGLFPVFEKTRGPVTALFSPAPNLKVPSLGPVRVDRDDGAGAAYDQRGHAFLDAALSCFQERFAPSYVLVRTTTGFSDHRPFLWAGFESTPQYSYAVDLSQNRSTLLDQFSSDLRAKIRTETPGLSISEEGTAGISAILDTLRARHEERRTAYRVTTEFVTDLFQALPAGVVRPYVVRQEDRVVGGMIALEYGDIAYRWQGGAKSDSELPVTEVLDWHVMQRAAERGCTCYDLVGANHPDVSQYKSMFDPELVTFQRLVKRTPTMDLLSNLYSRFG